ncbi:MAG: metal ABC transporter ATP-binding protein [bacterium]|nr:metal ABC transporter ATP-binding protein [bacterium]
MSIDSKNICVSVKNLSFRYNKEWILKNISFDIRQGEYVGIIGPNGGGKTTLVKILLGLLHPTEGTIHDACENHHHLRHRIGYIPQLMADGIRNFPATVREVVSAHAMRSWTLSEKEKNAVTSALQQTGMTELQDRLIGELSGGQLQRVLIAHALVGNPKILILDEPTLAIDLSGKEEFYQFLEKINREQGITIIMVSHDIDTVAKQVKHVLCVNQNLVCHGPPKSTMTPTALENLYGKERSAVDHTAIHHH